MGDTRGFLKYKRQPAQCRPVCERVKDYKEVFLPRSARHSTEQASRCMDCGTPFCHWGCPVGNLIPEWNDAVFAGKWEKAFKLLDATNNLPEITGRVCPAPCEYSCVLGINDEPVTIRENELAIIEYAYKNGLVSPNPPRKRTGKKVAVAGSGPAGLSCAHQLNKAGHKVTVFEKDDKIGGILRYGIPDFKLDKSVLDRRIEILEKEGIKFKTNVNVGAGLAPAHPINGRPLASRRSRGQGPPLHKDFDAFVLAGGCREPRDLKIPGRELNGIHFAMDYLAAANKTVGAGSKPALPDPKPASALDAKGKRVVVLGGGDTGADCVGVANRQGAKCVVQIEVMPMPSECRPLDQPWPKYPFILKTSTSHEEGAERKWSVLTKGFTGENGAVKKLNCVAVDIKADDKGCPVMREKPGAEFQIDADMVILALGFIRPQKDALITGLNLKLDERGNIKTGPDFMTSRKGYFSCGDMRRGQSLIAWAISEGRQCAHYVDKYLMRRTNLPIIPDFALETDEDA